MGTSLRLSNYAHLKLIPRYQNHSHYLLGDPSAPINSGTVAPGQSYPLYYQPITLSGAEAHLAVRVKTWKVSVQCGAYAYTNHGTWSNAFGGSGSTTTVHSLPSSDYNFVTPPLVSKESLLNNGFIRHGYRGVVTSGSAGSSIVGSAINAYAWTYPATSRPVTDNYSTTYTSYNSGAPPPSTSGTSSPNRSDSEFTFGDNGARTGIVYRLNNDEAYYLGLISFVVAIGDRADVTISNRYTDYNAVSAPGSQYANNTARATLKLPSLSLDQPNTLRLVNSLYTAGTLRASDSAGGYTDYPSRPLSVTIEPASYWEYADSQGRPVWDSTTGSRLHDPFG